MHYVEQAAPFAAIEESAIDVTEDQVTITSDHTQITQLNHIHETIEKVIRSKMQLFHVGKNDQLEPTRLGKEFISLPMYASRYALADYHPYIALARRAYDQFEISEYKSWPWSSSTVVELVKRLNEAIEWIRTEANSPRFKEARIKRMHLSNKNYRSLKSYLDALQENHAKLLIIRLDLYLTKKVRSEEQIAHADLERYRRHFLRRILINYSTAMVGYAWKLEYGLERNHHYHLMLIFNGNELKSDNKISHSLGKLWSDKVTQGRGSYFSCNSQKGRYRYCGIGMLEHRDAEKRAALDRACQYLTKTDFFVKYYLPEGGRTFGKGEIKHRRVDRGRKRQLKPHDPNYRAVL